MTVADLRAGPAHEFVDIAVVVREEDMMLDMLGRRTGIVAQPGQREIRAQSIEQRQRRTVCARRTQQAVGNLVADQRELRGREIACKFVRTDGAQFEVG